MDDIRPGLEGCRQLMAREKAEIALMRLRQELCACRLKPFEYDVAGQLLAEIGALVPAQTSFPVFHIGILADHTTTGMANAIRCAMLIEGMLAVVYEAPFGAVFQEIFDGNSGIYRKPRDAVLIAFHHHAIEYPEHPLTGAEQVEALAARMVGRLEEAWVALRAHMACHVFQHTLVPSGISWLGAVEHEMPASPDKFIARINQLCRDRAPAFVHWVDTASLAQRVGLRNWHDAHMFYYGKLGFSSQYARDYANVFLGAFRAATGRNRKCLVVDLDNTLWGGVVGDVGLEDLKLGPGTPEGEAYENFCLYLKNLQRRGVMLAVCSKNDEATAREVFERHPHMPLKLADFAAFCCNWEDKTGNLIRLAHQLNIDLSHLAFADDNPAECEWVRLQLPDVAVLELSGDPADFVFRVDEAHLFDAAHVSREDLLRTQSYRARQQVEGAKQADGNLDAYFGDLRMTGTCRRAGDAEVARLAQMEIKTNQFNVTTRRYNADQLRAFLRDENMAVFVCSLSDRFANHGIVSSVITRREGKDMVIDSWLMSCRVFARTLEQFIMNSLIEFARGNNIERIVGIYLPTPRNKVVKDLFCSLGFQPLGQEGCSRWHHSVRGVVAPLRTFVQCGGNVTP
ncbi:MAG: HAD-IIIC family phosphatase [Kiritimatiellae bacterium]|nr:HAD-IIIC family phosphatase [Kiritimatiellia bacterium]